MVLSFFLQCLDFAASVKCQLEYSLVASFVCVHGIKYSADMIILVGSCSGLQKFKQITQKAVINTEVLLVFWIFTSWYIEHLRAYELCFSGGGSLTVTQLSEMNDVFCLSCYHVKGNVYVLLKCYILLNGQKSVLFLFSSLPLFLGPLKAIN